MYVTVKKHTHTIYLFYPLNPPSAGSCYPVIKTNQNMPFISIDCGVISCAISQSQPTFLSLYAIIMENGRNQSDLLILTIW